MTTEIDKDALRLEFKRLHAWRNAPPGTAAREAPGLWRVKDETVYQRLKCLVESWDKGAQ